MADPATANDVLHGSWVSAFCVACLGSTSTRTNPLLVCAACATPRHLLCPGAARVVSATGNSSIDAGHLPISANNGNCASCSVQSVPNATVSPAITSNKRKYKLPVAHGVLADNSEMCLSCGDTISLQQATETNTKNNNIATVDDVEKMLHSKLCTSCKDRFLLARKALQNSPRNVVELMALIPYLYQSAGVDVSFSGKLSLNVSDLLTAMAIHPVIKTGFTICPTTTTKEPTSGEDVKFQLQYLNTTVPNSHSASSHIPVQESNKTTKIVDTRSSQSQVTSGPEDQNNVSTAQQESTGSDQPVSKGPKAVVKKMDVVMIDDSDDDQSLYDSNNDGQVESITKDSAESTHLKPDAAVSTTATSAVSNDTLNAPVSTDMASTVANDVLGTSIPVSNSNETLMLSESSLTGEASGGTIPGNSVVEVNIDSPSKQKNVRTKLIKNAIYMIETELASISLYFDSNGTRYSKLAAEMSTKPIIQVRDSNLLRALQSSVQEKKPTAGTNADYLGTLLGYINMHGVQHQSTKNLLSNFALLDSDIIRTPEEDKCINDYVKQINEIVLKKVDATELDIPLLKHRLQVFFSVRDDRKMQGKQKAT